MFRYEPYTRGYLIGIAKRFGMNSFSFRDSIFRTLRKGTSTQLIYVGYQRVRYC
jgi:hypothetical protein